MHKHCKLVFGGNERRDLRVLVEQLCDRLTISIGVTADARHVRSAPERREDVLRILASAVVRERSAEAFEAILEACRVCRAFLEVMRLTPRRCDSSISDGTRSPMLSLPAQDLV
jgi:hypothetical protein